MARIIKAHTKDNEFRIEYLDKKGGKKERIFYNGGFKQKQPNKMVDCDTLPQATFPKRTLAERLRKGVCELCGAEAELTMHHVRTLKSINGDTPWGKKMLGKHRKTLAVCADCYAKITNNDA